jgi:secondary thiamine-phosphate synthase enzyme
MPEPLQLHLGRLSVHTPGRGFVDVTAQVADWLAAQHASDGLLTIFIRHTSASLVVQENADLDVRADLERFFARLVPESSDFLHQSEGPDDMPAHIRAALTATSLGVPVAHGHLQLGTWQAIYVAEHRQAPHVRELALHFCGTGRD